MRCRICGSTDIKTKTIQEIERLFSLRKTIVSIVKTGNVYYRHHCGLILCDACSNDTPPKVCKEQFCKQYWGRNYQDVPYQIRNDFYEDYLLSPYDIKEYIRVTTTLPLIS